MYIDRNFGMIPIVANTEEKELFEKSCYYTMLERDGRGLESLFTARNPVLYDRRVFEPKELLSTCIRGLLLTPSFIGFDG